MFEKRAHLCTSLYRVSFRFLNNIVKIFLRKTLFDADEI